MKRRKLLILLLALEGALSAAAAVAVAKNVFAAESAAGFPFAQSGRLLRAMSLSGGFGNAAAIALWLMLSLWPLAVFFLPKLKKRPEDALLWLLAAANLGALYLAVNPSLIPYSALLGSSLAASAAASLPWALLAAWAVLRFLRYSAGGGIPRKFACMSALLCVAAAASVFRLCFSGVLSAVRAAESPCPAAALALTLLSSGVYAFWLVSIFPAFRLLSLLRADRYAPEAAAIAGRLSRRCGAAAAAFVLCCAAANALNLLFAPKLSGFSVSLSLPLLPLLVSAAMMLLSGGFAEARRLKADSDLMI